MLALGSLYVVAAALRSSGALDLASRWVLGASPDRVWRVLLRMCPSVALYSAFLNNTPVVAMGIPTIRRWARRHGVAPSKLLMPLSFAAILGGLCTLVGTSTNLVAHGLLEDHGLRGFGFFELAWIGVPVAVAGLLYLIGVSPFITPTRRDIREEEQRRAQLVHAPDATERELHQAVVREGSHLVGNTVESAQLLERFGAVVTGVWRGGKRLEPPPGEIVLRPGDVLMLDTERGFRGLYENTHAFLITSEAGGEKADAVHHPEERRPAGRNLWLSSAVMLAIVVTVASGVLHIAIASVLGVTVLVLTGVIDPGRARRAVDWSVLLVVGAALGLGSAVEHSGAARLIGSWLVGITVEHGPYAVVAGFVVTTALLTEVITNSGAVALMFPVALAVADDQGYQPRALLVGVTLAASMSLLTPIGYQTNLMVYGPGNYRFTDFVRVGGLLQVLLWLVVIGLAPAIWHL